MVHIVQYHRHPYLHDFFAGRHAYIAAITPVSVPLSDRIKDGISLASCKYSRCHRPITFGSEFVTHIRNQSIFLVAVSIYPYMANGNVLF